MLREITRSLGLFVMVPNADSPPNIDVLKGDLVSPKVAHQVGEPLDRVDDRLNVDELGANVHLNTDGIEVLAVARLAVKLHDPRGLDRQTCFSSAPWKYTDGFAGRRPGSPERKFEATRRFSAAATRSIALVRPELHVKRHNIGVDRLPNFAVGFPDTSENHAFGAENPRGKPEKPRRRKRRQRQRPASAKSRAMARLSFAFKA